VKRCVSVWGWVGPGMKTGLLRFWGRCFRTWGMPGKCFPSPDTVKFRLYFRFPLSALRVRASSCAQTSRR
jgi:hypothetical protein